jgi:small subunit ribosomal protein S6
MPETPPYDLTLLLDAELPSERREQIVSDIVGAIETGGELVGRHDWGVRALAYEIRHKKEADYHLIQFNGPATLLADLQRILKFTDGIVRHRIIKLAPGTPPPPSLRAETVPPPAEGEPAPA